MLLAVAVFIAVFILAGLLIAATGTGASEREKVTLARLDAVLAADITKSKDEMVDLRREELLSAIPFLNRLLLQIEVAPKLRRLLYQANLKWTPGGLLLMSFSTWVFASYAIYLVSGLPLPSVALGLLPAALPYGYASFMRQRRFDQFEAGLPAAIDLMVSGLRGGHSLVAALGLVGREVPDPIGREFQVCFDEQNYGLELRTAMQNLATRVPIQDVKIIITAILIQKETGGNLAEVLDKCAHVIRERFRLKREINTKTAQGRLTGWILSILPVALGVVLFTVNPKGISVLWTDPLGRQMLWAGVIMTVTGALIMRKIVRIRV